MRSTSPASFTRRSSSTSVPAGTTPSAKAAGQLALLRPRDAVLLERDRSPTGAAATSSVALGRRGEADLDARVDAGRAELLVGALRVAAVGDEQRVVGRHEQHRGRTGEPGEVADVRELRDEQRVDARLGQPGAQPREARRDVERCEWCSERHARASISSAAASIASR